MSELKTPHEWCKQYRVALHDADGWVVSVKTYGGPKPYSEPICLEEFYYRASISTVGRADADWEGIERALREAPSRSI